MRRGTKFLTILLLAAASSSGAAASAQAATPVSLPFELPFSSDRGGIADAGGRGTGFRLLQAPGGGLRSDLLTLDTANPAGLLRIRTTPGIAIRAANSQDNALGVAVPADGRALIVETTLVLPPPGTGQFEQAGIWFGTSQDNYVKLVLISRRGVRVHMLHEQDASVRKTFYGPALSPVPGEIKLRLRIDRSGGDLTGAYEVPGQPAAAIGTWALPAGLADGAVSQAGIFATHRLGTAQLEYNFDRFGVRCVAAGCPAGAAPPDPDMGDGRPPVGEPGDGDEVDPPAGGTSPTRKTSAGAESGTRNQTWSQGWSSSGKRAVFASARRQVRLRALRRRGLTAHVRCTERCDVDVDLFARRAGKRRLTLIAARGATASAVERSFKMRPTARAVRRLRGVRKLKLRVVARFADGSTASVSRRVLLRR